MVCAQKGYPLVVTMADSFSIERRKLMRMLGAKVVLTPRAAEGLRHVPEGGGAGEDATAGSSPASSRPTANADIHETTTAREIINDFAGERLDYFVTGYGTGGTVAGVGARAAQGAAGDEDRPVRAGERAAGRQRQRRRSAAPTARRPAAIRRSSRIRSRAGRRTSSPTCCRRRSTASYYDELIPIAGPEGIKWAQRAGAEGRHLHRHLRRRDVRRGACRSPRARRPAR